MNEPMQPEELTELLDEDLEMWAQGGTRILPKSELERARPTSIAPVAFPSVPPAMMTAPPPATSHAPVLAVFVGMAAVFFLAAVGGGIFYAIHLRAASASASAPVEVATTSPIATTDPEPVTLTTTTESVIAPTTTTTATPKIARVEAVAPPPVRYGAVQTFAAGAGKPVFLDGKPIGTGGARIKAACGKHSVSVGSGKAKTYDIPCNGGAITVGTPDGT